MVDEDKPLGIPPSLNDNPNRYDRIGADGDEEGMYVRFDPGFGMNVIIGMRANAIKVRSGVWDGRSFEGQDLEGPGRGMMMSLDGWETLCSFVDEFRARQGKKPGVWVVYAYDTSPYPIKAFEEEIDAHRYKESISFGFVKFWEAGTEWVEVDKHV